jgi:hypothetical protein
MEEKTSKEVAAIAAKVLAGKPCTDAELKSLAASALTHDPDWPRANGVLLPGIKLTIQDHF